MIIKHNSSFSESEVMRELERQEIRKGHYDLKPDEIVRLAAREVKAESNLKPSEDWDQDMAKLIAALNKNGYQKNASDLSEKYFMFKQAQSLYGVTPDSNEDILNMAHSDGDVPMCEARNDYGKVETIMSTSKKMREIAEKNPIGKQGSSKKALSKTAQEDANNKLYNALLPLSETLTNSRLPVYDYRYINWESPEITADKQIYCREAGVSPGELSKYGTLYSVYGAHSNVTNEPMMLDVAKKLAPTFGIVAEDNELGDAMLRAYKALGERIWGTNNAKYNAANNALTTAVNNINAILDNNIKQLNDRNTLITGNQINKEAVANRLAKVKYEISRLFATKEGRLVYDYYEVPPSKVPAAKPKMDEVNTGLKGFVEQTDRVLAELTGSNIVGEETKARAKQVLDALWEAAAKSDRSLGQGSADGVLYRALARPMQLLLEGRISTLGQAVSVYAEIAKQNNQPAPSYGDWDVMFNDLLGFSAQAKESGKSAPKVETTIGQAVIESSAKPQITKTAWTKPSDKGKPQRTTQKGESVARQVSAPSAVKEMQQLVSRMSNTALSPDLPASSQTQALLKINDDGTWGPKTTKALEIASKYTQKISGTPLVTAAPKEPTELETTAKQNANILTQTLFTVGVNPKTGTAFTPVDKDIAYGSKTNAQIYPQNLMSIDAFYYYLLNSLGIKPIEGISNKETILDTKNKPTETKLVGVETDRSTAAGKQQAEQRTEQAGRGRRVANLVNIAENIIRTGQVAMPPAGYNPSANWITAQQFSEAVDFFANRANTSVQYATENRRELEPGQVQMAEWYSKAMNSIKSKWDSIKGGLDRYTKVDPAYLRSAKPMSNVGGGGAEAGTGTAETGRRETREESVARKQQQRAATGGIAIDPGQPLPNPFTKPQMDFMALADRYGALKQSQWIAQNMATSVLNVDALRQSLMGFYSEKTGGGNYVSLLNQLQSFSRKDAVSARDFFYQMTYVLNDIMQIALQGWSRYIAQYPETVSQDINRLRENQRNIYEEWINVLSNVGSSANRLPGKPNTVNINPPQQSGLRR